MGVHASNPCVVQGPVVLLGLGLFVQGENKETLGCQITDMGHVSSFWKGGVWLLVAIYFLFFSFYLFQE